MLLLGLLVYKLNDYFKNDKTYAMQSQVRKRVITVKTSVSGQLAQLRNTVSSFETGLNEANVNWVQLDPFFALARVQNTNGVLKVEQIVSRSNTSAERWNPAYLEGALRINQSRQPVDILVQLYKDQLGTKYMLVRFNVGGGHEVVVAGLAGYFQKYFDIERGSRNQSLLVTSEKILAAHTEADYIVSPTKEASLSPKQYIIEKEEIVGTNLTVVSYVPKSKVAPGFVVPWSILGVVVGFGFILIGFVFYSLDPLERRIEKYKKQEREQIYKDTVQAANEETMSGVKAPSRAITREEAFPTQPPMTAAQDADTPPPRSASDLASEFENSKPKRIQVDEEFGAKPFAAEPPPKSSIEIIDLLERSPRREVAVSEVEKSNVIKITEDTFVPSAADKLQANFVTLDEENIDLDEIEKALALDDFEQDQPAGSFSVGAANALEKNLRPQKINLDRSGTSIDEPQFVFEKKDFKVDEIKINVRRPERT